MIRERLTFDLEQINGLTAHMSPELRLEYSKTVTAALAALDALVARVTELEDERARFGIPALLARSRDQTAAERDAAVARAERAEEALRAIAAARGCAVGLSSSLTSRRGGGEDTGMSGLKLTKRQERAMLAFLWKSSPRGFDDEACDAAVWNWGVRPWPTMDNLVTKGLVERDSWYGPEEGWLYRLTETGRSYMAEVVASRAERTQE